MYRERASFPGHRLLPLTCVSIERWWTGEHVSSSSDGLDAEGMDRTDCTIVLSHTQAVSRVGIQSVSVRQTSKGKGKSAEKNISKLKYPFINTTN